MAFKEITRTLHASGAELASGVGSSQACDAESGAVYLDVTGVSGSPDTLDVTIEERQPGTANWYQIAAFTQVPAAGGVTSERVALSGYFGRRLRTRWVITGSSPGFTFEVTFAGEKST
jgi:hypothetical protein